MSWNIRDYRTTQTGDTPTVPPPAFQDDDPLPTHAYFAGLEAYEQDPNAGLPLWQRQAMREQGLWETRTLDRFAAMVRRGITEI